MLTTPAAKPKDKPAQSSDKLGGAKDKPWYPRFWSGITVGPWFALLWRNRFDIGLRRIVMANILSTLAAINSLLRLVQIALVGRRISRTQITDEPIFILGHWRSGTTLLHELIVRDKRFTYPDTYACFAPNHFVISAWILKPLLRFLLPAQRPMDNMPAGWSHPQEDEFALCNLGARSPYLTFVFPNHPPQDQDFLDLNVPPKALARWKSCLLRFLKSLTYQKPGRVALKSPPHTARVKTLLEMFPKAKFIHIVRDPFVLFSSTCNLWRRLYRDQGLQYPLYEGLEEHVFATLVRMYEAFERDRALIPAGQFSEVRYEDLVKSPVSEMQRVYAELELGEFDKARPALEAYFAEQKEYKTNRYALDPETRAEIARRWEDYIERYGYQA